MRLVLVALLIFLPLSTVFKSLSEAPEVNQSQNYVGADWARNSLEIGEDGALIMADWGLYPIFKYFQIVEGLRPEVKVVLEGGHASFLNELIEAHQGRPIYLTTLRPEWREKFILFPTLTGSANLYKVLEERPSLEVQEPFERELKSPLPFGPHLLLLGCFYEPTEVHRGEVLSIRFLWKVAKPLEGPTHYLLTFLHQGKRPLLTQEFQLGYGLYQPEELRADRVIEEAYRIVLPSSLPPGPYLLALGLGGEAQEMIALGSVKLK